MCSARSVHLKYGKTTSGRGVRDMLNEIYRGLRSEGGGMYPCRSILMSQPAPVGQKDPYDRHIDAIQLVKNDKRVTTKIIGGRRTKKTKIAEMCILGV